MAADDPSSIAGRRVLLLVAVIAAIGGIAVALINGLFDGGGGGGGSKGATKTQVSGDTQVAGDGGTNSDNDGCEITNTGRIEGDINCPPPVPSVSPSPAKPQPTTADAGCGTLEDVPKARSFKLAVVMWCAPPALRGQFQYKLKVKITNTGTRPLDIRQERFVLLWRTLNRSRWTPPPGGAPTPPHQVTYGHRRYWAIHANLDDVSEPRPKYGDYTFETHWKHTTLAPGKTSLRPRKDAEKLRFQDPDDQTIKTIRFNYHEDDLVFYVPRRTVNRDRNFLGLAYITANGRVRALCEQDDWGPKVPPSIF